MEILKKKGCIVCFGNLGETDRNCPVCGFSAEMPSFLTKEQYEEWIRTVVIPYRNRYFKKKIELSAAYQEKQARKIREKLLLRMRRDSSFCGAFGFEFEARIERTGRVKLLGNCEELEEEVQDWKDIQAVAAGDYHLVGLHTDGTVIAAGKNHAGQCGVSGWKGIVQIAAWGNQTAALDQHGKIHVCGSPVFSLKEAENWENITKIALSNNALVGLRADGTVRAAGSWVSTETFSTVLAGWKNIQDIAVRKLQIIVLKKNGKVYEAGVPLPYEVRVEDWEDVAAIQAADNVTACITNKGEIIIEETGFSRKTVYPAQGYVPANLVLSKEEERASLYSIEEASPYGRIAVTDIDFVEI